MLEIPIVGGKTEEPLPRRRRCRRAPRELLEQVIPQRPAQLGPQLLDLRVHRLVKRDPGKEIGRAYGVLGKLGRARRASFLVDGEGTVRRTYPQVDATTHALEVLQDLRSMA